MPDPDSLPEMRDRERPPVALIAGPTASGKSAVAMRLALATGGIIINADASQVYADLNVLTARPPEEDLAQAPHRLFGHIDGMEDCSAARWAQEAKAEIYATHAQGVPAILVGGTGLYLHTLLHGIAPVPAIDPAIREAVRALPVAQSYAALELEDPVSAARLNPADTSRVARALEVVRSTGTPLPQWQARREGGLAGHMRIHGAVVMLPREVLAERAEQRLDLMLAHGAIEEVEALVRRDIPPDRPVLRALGVRELAAMLAGQIDLATARAAILQQTIAYQKRQRTWARGRQAGWTTIDPQAEVTIEDLNSIAPEVH
ncbi:MULTISPECIES: tRNA (adenosine(37)-N6)-dimethylallyltransferase MiaA [unclassified Sphingobium]|uniref:tRNA (adenosine(37)-N6)-dimethylallyltransferase MiaA n=1 Tax=unclassified Sphingobium TaxID=2611147 RepID=UPI002224991F|nr:MULTISPECIES: tRNA (adenosine(37)-N6)-dimethylallyltransferase MiaA [unclassified Sphingobium]MCW2412589.1 tRNA dimethylallyltransferase [Sphingobium sp. B8D3D]MCW2415114.1 tRNA dimethylallyltransferase [Sphingobium sp. B8D3A]